MQTFDSSERYILQKGDPAFKSGRQEMLESLEAGKPGGREAWKLESFMAFQPYSLLASQPSKF